MYKNEGANIMTKVKRNHLIFSDGCGKAMKQAIASRNITIVNGLKILIMIFSILREFSINFYLT